jgi:nicotinamidase-related amidase
VSGQPISVSGLLFGPIGRRALHVATDMQRVFAEPTEWHTPRLEEIAPKVAAIAEHRPDRTVFTRFITPRSSEQAVGAWCRYYERWRSVCTGEMDPAMLELIEPLRRFVPPAEVADKTTYSAFESDAFNEILTRRDPDTLIFTGVETEVCVIATALTAVDRGYRVIVVGDAVASSSPDGHRAGLETVHARFGQQIETIAANDLVAAWTD